MMKLKKGERISNQPKCIKHGFCSCVCPFFPLSQKFLFSLPQKEESSPMHSNSSVEFVIEKNNAGEIFNFWQNCLMPRDEASINFWMSWAGPFMVKLLRSPFTKLPILKHWWGIHTIWREEGSTNKSKSHHTQRQSRRKNQNLSKLKRKFLTILQEL